MADSIFLNLIRGNRIKSYLGLDLPPAVPARYGHDYIYVEIADKPQFLMADGTLGFSLKKNAVAQMILPDYMASLKPRLLPALLKFNPELQEFLSMDSLHLIDKDEAPRIWVQARKDISELEPSWLVRCYIFTVDEQEEECYNGTSNRS